MSNVVSSSQLPCAKIMVNLASQLVLKILTLDEYSNPVASLGSAVEEKRNGLDAGCTARLRMHHDAIVTDNGSCRVYKLQHKQR